MKKHQRDKHLDTEKTLKRVTKLTRKKLKEETPAPSSYRPAGQKPPKFLRVLEDWRSVMVTVMDGKKHGHVVEYIVAPNKRIYRRAVSWENPTLVIDAPILPHAHEIHLVRVKNAQTKKEVRRALRSGRSR